MNTTSNGNNMNIELNTSSKIHIGFAIFWAIMIVPTILWWPDSILWVAFISLYALVATHISSYEAANNRAVDKETHIKLNALVVGLAAAMEMIDNLTPEKPKQDILDDITNLKKSEGIENRESA